MERILTKQITGRVEKVFRHYGTTPEIFGFGEEQIDFTSYKIRRLSGMYKGKAIHVAIDNHLLFPTRGDMVKITVPRFFGNYIDVSRNAKWKAILSIDAYWTPEKKIRILKG